MNSKKIILVLVLSLVMVLGISMSVAAEKPTAEPSAVMIASGLAGCLGQHHRP